MWGHPHDSQGLSHSGEHTGSIAGNLPRESSRPHSLNPFYRRGMLSARSRLPRYSVKARRPSERRLHPRAGFRCKELFRRANITGILQLAQVDGEVAAGQAQRPLDEAVGHPVRLRLGHQQRHDAQPCGLMNRLIQDDGRRAHATRLLRIHTHATATMASIRTADSTGAASPAKCVGT